jgi:hypothetical protein
MIIKCAKYLGCTPWELAEQPIGWFYRALAAMEADCLIEQSAYQQVDTNDGGGTGSLIQGGGIEQADNRL